MTRTELKRLEAEHERARDFHAHLVPPHYDKVRRVEDDHDYLRLGFFKRIVSLFSIGVFRLAGVFAGGYCRLKVDGKKNLRGVKRAILTSNHINICDCILIRRAVGLRKLKITVAEFNNWRGVFGELIRAGGTLPIGSTVGSLRNLNRSITELLNRDNLILFYPEGSLWWCYEKPRPLIEGAFLSAARNGVPVVPMFFTFKTIRKRRDGTDRVAFTLHVGKPITPDKTAPAREDAVRLAGLVWTFNRTTYEQAYGKPLAYEPAAASEQGEREEHALS